MEYIYTLTVISNPTKKLNIRGEVYESSNHFTLGWFNKIDYIEEIIKGEHADGVYERGEYPLVIIEKVPPHIYPMTITFDSSDEKFRWWYKWSVEKNHYVECAEPEEYSRISCLAMG